MWALSVNANFIRLLRSFADIGQKLYNWNGANAPREPKYFLISSDPLTESVRLRKSHSMGGFLLITWVIRHLSRTDTKWRGRSQGLHRFLG